MSKTLQQLLSREARKIGSIYKAPADEIESFLSEELDKRAELRTLIENNLEGDRVLRMRDFRDFIKRCRKRIYYQLRDFERGQISLADLAGKLPDSTGHPNGTNEETARLLDTIEATHVSTAERSSDLTTMLDLITGILPPPRRVIDLGCGVFPVSLFRRARAWLKNLETYRAIDQDRDAIEILKKLAGTGDFPALRPEHMKLDSENLRKIAADRASEADVIFLFKFVSLLLRHDKDAYRALCEMPGKALVITASRQSLTKRKSIARREHAILRDFAEKTGRDILTRWEGSSEIMMILQ